MYLPATFQTIHIVEPNSSPVPIISVFHGESTATDRETVWMAQTSETAPVTRTRSSSVVTTSVSTSSTTVIRRVIVMTIQMKWDAVSYFGFHK